ncbi:Mu transposase C-terminal domain-containing protein [Alkalimonas mucilaginosa]|uniref:Mu transposase C-terminal domain-containing protein n=1 Tax=Alkalimonas mucilaginosa TaxID=3057676 RepID=A0ABU7JHA6_9GAMM|nr:Mu transposase C-terminal domain-containing protein [Alkalimonas sp. MEB004]MEE2025062.1 Mu transposase C-terminal domain-containing protein [Alkalimonas sp. MEB004]
MTMAMTAQQIAAAIAVADRTIRIRANKENWAYELRTGRGGQIKHFIVSELPDDIRSVILCSGVAAATPSDAMVQQKAKAHAKKLTAKQQLTNQVNQSRKADALAELAGMQGPAKTRAENALIILKAAERFTAQSGLPKVAAWRQFCEHYNSRQADVPANAYDIKPTIGFSTLARWASEYEKNGITALAGKYGKNKGTGLIDSEPVLHSFCMAMLREYPHIKGDALYEALSTEFSGEFTIPAPATCRSWLKRWKEDNQELFMSLCDPSGWQNKRMVAFGNKSFAISRINQLWEFDSTPADVMLKDGRYSIVGVIDVFTRRVKCILRPTSNAEAISLLIRETILDWGLPEVARTDNGSDYTSAHISSVWDALGIEHDVTNPYSGWEKPFIERFFRTFSHGIAELCQGYIGHSVADRQKINARLTFEQRLLERRKKGEDKIALNVDLTAEQFEAFISQWIENHYHHARHSSLNCSPFEKFVGHQQHIRRLDNAHVLDILLAPVPGNKGYRTVNKSDGISVEGGSYVHAELGAYIGERVYCRWNPKDVGKIYVFHALKHHFICEAVNPEIAGNGLELQDIAIEAKAIQRKQQRERRAEFKKAAKQHQVGDIAQRILDAKTAQNGNLSAMPKRSEQAVTNLTQAAEAAIAASQQTEPAYTEQQLSEFEKRRKELEALEKKAATPVFSSDAHKARYLTELSLSTDLPAVEKAWLHDYRRRNKAAARMLDEMFNTNKASK